MIYRMEGLPRLKKNKSWSSRNPENPDSDKCFIVQNNRGQRMNSLMNILKWKKFASRIIVYSLITITILLFITFGIFDTEYLIVQPADLVEGEEQTVLGLIWEARVTNLGARKGTEAIIGDETGNIRAVWFNQTYVARQLVTNSWIVLSGKVSAFRGQKVFESPEWDILKGEELIHTGRLVPVYPLTQGLYPRQARRLAKEALDNWLPGLKDFLPEEIGKRHRFPERGFLSV